MTELMNVKGAKAVLYPLQTFTKKDKLDWKIVPLLLEAGNNSVLNSLKRLFSGVTKKIYSVRYADRVLYHLAAVFVNNFSNAMAVGAKSILKDNDFKLLYPLMDQTLSKIKTIGPLKAQTGPAKRGDKETMKFHRSILKQHKELKKIYSLMSKTIKEQQK